MDIMSEAYYAVMSLGGIMALVGILLTWHLSRRVEARELGTKKLSNLLLAGGILTALGFIMTIADISERYITFAILMGPAVIVYSLSESGLVRANILTLIQIALVVMSPLLSSGREPSITEIFSTISLILLINVLPYYKRTPLHYRRLAWLSSWGLVMLPILRAYPRTRPFGPVVYIFSMGVWVYTLTRLLRLAEAS